MRGSGLAPGVAGNDWHRVATHVAARWREEPQASFGGEGLARIGPATHGLAGGARQGPMGCGGVCRAAYRRLDKALHGYAGQGFASQATQGGAQSRNRLAIPRRKGGLKE